MCMSGGCGGTKLSTQKKTLSTGAKKSSGSKSFSRAVRATSNPFGKPKISFSGRK